MLSASYNVLMIQMTPWLVALGGGALALLALMSGYWIGGRVKEARLSRAMDGATALSTARQEYRRERQSREQPPTIERDTVTAKKILILGANSPTRSAEGWLWHEVPAHTNVADYDIVLLVLRDLLREDYAASLDVDSLPSRDQFARLIFSQATEVVFIGEPWAVLGGAKYRPYMPISRYLPVLFEWTTERSESIEVVNSDLRFFFQDVDHALFHFDTTAFEDPDERILLPYLNAVDSRANDIAIEYHTVAQTRFGKAVALELIYIARHIGRVNEKPVPLRRSGSVIWLPTPTRQSSQEMIRGLLQHRYGVHLNASIPDWASLYKTPIQLVIEDQIEKRKAELADVTEKLGRLTADLDAASRFSRLLYEQGDPLEEIVREALRLLGAAVEDPRRRGHEDGRLQDPTGRQAMLEIKGLQGTLRARDLRELHQWIGDAVGDEQWTGKGILVANTYCQQLPEKRGDIAPNSDFLKSLSAYGFIVMGTIDLFEAIVRQQSGDIDLTQFWDSIFDASGRVWIPTWRRASNR